MLALFVFVLFYVMQEKSVLFSQTFVLLMERNRSVIRLDQIE